MKSFMGMELSELGVGTYLGEPDERTSEGYQRVMLSSVEYGINVVDTAIVYRYMRSERDIGKVLKKEGRERFIVSTKGGYVPYDLDSGLSFRDYLYENFLRTGLLKPEEISQGHSLSVDFIRWCLRKSLENMETDYVDIYFLHNPEEQLLTLDRRTFRDRIRACFEYLEDEARKGRIKYYGLATWNGFRVGPTEKQYLDLYELFKVAEEVGGEEHRFRFIQLPYNLGMTEAFTLKNQKVGEKELSTLEACRELGLYVYTSASILQGRVVGRVAKALKDRLGVDSDVLASLQFVLSTPGVGTALVGMSKLEHLQENARILNMPRLDLQGFLALFE